jgi:putative ABC transport system permease protein
MNPNWKQIVREHLAVLRLPPEREIEIVEELALCFEAVYEDALAAGLSEEEAEAHAVQGYDWRLLECELSRAEHPLAVRVLQPSLELIERRGGMRMESLLQDLRFGVRMLAKNPGFTLIAVLTLALGIGANTAIFSLINSALLKPLPYPDAERIVTVWETLPDGNRNSISAGAYKDWRARSTKLSHVALLKDVRLNLTGSGAPEHLAGLWVSTEFLSVLGVKPLLGRDFLPGEDAKGGNNQVVLLSHQLWQQQYGGNASIVGQTISLNQLSYTVIGVLPPNVLPQSEHKFLLPFVMDVDTDTVRWTRGYHCCGAIGRVAPGATLAQAQAELRAIKQQLMAEYPPDKKDWSVGVAQLQQDLTGDARPTLTILLGTVALVLLIACANVSNLLLARGNARAREIAIRSALGAGSGRIVRQLLMESLLLALLGGVLGLGLASFGIELLAKMLAGMLPSMLRPELDWRVLTFSLVIACGSGLLFGLWPALRASRPDLQHVLKESERGSLSASRRRSQSALVVAEFALTIVLLIGAGLFLRSFVRLLATDPGFNTQQTLAFDLSFPKAKYPKAEDQQRFLQDVSKRLMALPGIEAAGAATTLPLSRSGRGGGVRRADQPDGNGYGVRDDFISGDYFSALQIKLLRGRLLTEADNLPTAPPVLVIDEKVARDLYPGEEAIGKTLKYGPKSWEIVGIVPRIRHGSLEQEPPPRIYGPRAQFSYPTAGMVVRSALPPATLVETIRKTILEVDSHQPIANVRTLEEAVSNSLARQRTTLILLGLFAAVAIGLACLGIYGVMSYTIGQRAHEFAIRGALGAQRRDIFRLVLSSGLKLSLLGIAVGLGAAFFLARLVEKLLFEIQARDPLVFLAAVCLLGIAAAVSVYLPARRATKVDPLIALRHE